ncbi:related to Eukaryotic translation initiation factor 3 subunit B [Saccharomycodes ludwigii]|uniref:Eukaryotic translation initiation factor 3 subunit B n=1 Tax=Saccharomycodes ludwigii TaxID=36035 RepID=A0A376B357_9ASCO|nr:hypothetical protein SCDLUD_003344 [Saccharomycodes ludwigii]KAH3900369.1 hypothetical protein SCDLUD_003344 [Saccharomycodes ludwigii]SSD58904.1 related to Eukaryotic translation initiation factor 3 subunit B [Saccharomycodes ludwigii]
MTDTLAPNFPEIKLEDIHVNEDEIDFSDLKEQYEIISDNTSETKNNVKLDRFVVVDGTPIAPESKVPILTKVLTKLFSQAGEIKDFNLPMDTEEKKTKGYLFIEYANELSVRKAVKLLNGKKLDAKHRLFVNSFRDLEKYGSTENFSAEFKEPVVPKPVSKTLLDSWLLDEYSRDQFSITRDDDTLIAWYRGAHKPENIVEPRRNWSNAPIKFSPFGTYVLSLHEHGVQSWGGPELQLLHKFFHPQVRAVHISPTEKYLVTFSPKPIMLSDNAELNGPFTPEMEGHNIVVWDLATGVLLKTFGIPGNQEFHWPMIKWSYDDKYCGRIGPNAIAIYEPENNFQLSRGELLKVNDVQDFEFAPTGVLLHKARKSNASKITPEDYSTVLCYWTPENNNQSCKATVMELPKRRILRTVNLVQVSDVRFHWQSNSEYLCVQVDRHTKSKKSIFTNLEICKMGERDIPVEKIELKDHVLSFAWEPKGDRFITISIDEAGRDENIAVPQNVVTFFAPEVDNVTKTGKGAAAGSDVKSWKSVYSLPNKFSNKISWSPMGRFVCITTLIRPPQVRNQSEFLFYDMDYPGEHILNKENKTGANKNGVNCNLRDISNGKYGSGTNMQWDKSGRYLACWSSYLRHRVDNGYRVYTCTGKLIRQEGIDGFVSFSWRPRPDHLLSSSEIKKIKKNFKEYSAKFEEMDMMEANEALRTAILDRRSKLQNWNSFRAATQKSVAPYKIFENFSEVEDHTKSLITIEEIQEKILEEKKEVV